MDAFTGSQILKDICLRYLYFVLTATWHVFVSETKHSLMANSASFRRVNSALSELMGKPQTWCLFGRLVVNEQMLPRWLVSWPHRQVFVLSTESTGMEGDKTRVTIVEWHWAWRRPTSYLNAKLLQVKEDVRKPNRITVIENCGRGADSYTRLCTELAVREDVPPGALQRAEQLADMIVEQFQQGHQACRVYLMLGRGALGKTLTGRLVTRNLNGKLYTDYDPRSIEHDMKGLVSRYTQSDRMSDDEGDGDDHDQAPYPPLVVMMDEADRVMWHIARETVPKPDGVEPDAFDKPSWNRLSEGLHNKRNLILIMTANQTVEGMMDAVKFDDTFLRAGRVHKFIVEDPNEPGAMRMQDPPTKEEYERASGGIITTKSIITDDSAWSTTTSSADAVAATKKKMRGLFKRLAKKLCMCH